jgi:hypothetical protein
MAAIADDAGQPPPDLSALRQQLQAAGVPEPALPDRLAEEPSEEPATGRNKK